METLTVNTLRQLGKLHNKHVNIVLNIDTGTDNSGISLLELLNALDFIKRHPNINLVSLSSESPHAYEFEQAIFQARYYFPNITNIKNVQ